MNRNEQQADWRFNNQILGVNHLSHFEKSAIRSQGCLSCLATDRLKGRKDITLTLSV